MCIFSLLLRFSLSRCKDKDVLKKPYMRKKWGQENKERLKMSIFYNDFQKPVKNIIGGSCLL